jgi:hypothetical protein
MAAPPASAAVPRRETAQGSLAWLTHVGVVIGIGLIVLVSSLAIGAPATSMAEHGVSVDDFQSAGTSANAEQAYDDLGLVVSRVRASLPCQLWSTALRRLRLCHPPTRCGRSRTPRAHCQLCRDLRFARRCVGSDSELRPRGRPLRSLRPAGSPPRRGIRLSHLGLWHLGRIRLRRGVDRRRGAISAAGTTMSLSRAGSRI